MMEATIKFVLVALVTRLHIVTSLRIEISPTAYNEEATGPVEISCFPDLLDGCTGKDLMMLEVGKVQQSPWVFIRQGQGISYGLDTPKSYKAHGHLDADASKSYLNITISHPKNEDTGVYECAMFYFTRAGQLKKETVSANLTVEIFDLHAVVKYLREHSSQVSERLSILEDKAQFSESRELYITRELENQKVQVSQVMSLEADVQNLTRQVEHQTEEAAYVTAFSASLTTGSVSNGKVFQFNNILMQRGQGYDKSTGIFSAPKSGLYVFHLTMRSNQMCCPGRVNLQVKGRVVARLYIEVPKGTDDHQSTVHAVTELEPGDEVKVVAWNGMKWTTDTHSVFSGYLLKVY